MYKNSCSPLYVLIHPELQKKYFQTKFCCCTVQFCTVRYCTVQGTTPPHKSEFFFFAFLDESGHLQCFPNAFRKNPKKSKKKFGIGPDPHWVGKFPNFLGFFFLTASLTRLTCGTVCKSQDSGQWKLWPKFECLSRNQTVWEAATRNGAGELPPSFQICHLHWFVQKLVKTFVAAEPDLNPIKEFSSTSL